MTPQFTIAAVDTTYCNPLNHELIDRPVSVTVSLLDYQRDSVLAMADEHFCTSDPYR